MSTEHLSTRVNSARLPHFLGKTIRLTCKILKKSTDLATVEAPDGGEVTIQLMRDANIVDPYVEVIGKVIDPTTVKMIYVVNLGPDLDLKLVNDAIELIHDPRFYTRIFA